MRNLKALIPRRPDGVPAALCCLLLLNLLGCSSENSARRDSSDESTAILEVESKADSQIDCGNLITDAQLNAYVRLIEQTGDEEYRHWAKIRELFAANITLIKGGQTLRATRDELEAVRHTLPLPRDWQTMAAALAAGNLESGGWRGCFLSSGKATFVADARGNLGLSSFDFDREWQAN